MLANISFESLRRLPTPSVARMVAFAAGLLAVASPFTGVLVAASSTGVSKPTTPMVPTESVLSPADNPYGFHVSYQVAWLNKDQGTFGASFIVSLANPLKGASWALRVQFADASTRADSFWGNWNLTRLPDGMYLAVPIAGEGGSDPVPVGDTSKRAYSFNGRYDGTDPNACYPNGYLLGPNPAAKSVMLTKSEATNTPLGEGLPSVPGGEFLRQQRSASGASSTNTVGGSDSASGTATAADAASTNSTTSGSSGSPLLGLCVFGGVLAVGLTVVGVATYRRRQYRQDARSKQTDQDLELSNSKRSMGGDGGAANTSIGMPPPTAINNHSTAARAAAGAVIMEEMSAEQAMAEEYYVMEDVTPDAHHHHLSGQQHADQMAADEYAAVGVMPEHDDGVYYAEYNEERHQEVYPMDGENMGQYDMQMQDGVDAYGEQNQQPLYEDDYVEGLPDYAVQYDDFAQPIDDISQSEYVANASGNGAIEHVDLRPPVAQEYYVADAIGYDDADQQGMQASAGEEYNAYEASEFEAAEFDGPYEPHSQH